MLITIKCLTNRGKSTNLCYLTQAQCFLIQASVCSRALIVGTLRVIYDLLVPSVLVDDPSDHGIT